MEVIAAQHMSTYLDALASRASIPGGGAAAAVTVSQGAALLSMVLHLTVGRKRYAEHEATLRPILARTDELRDRALQLADQDAAAFAAVSTCYGMSKKTPEEKAARQAALDQALLAAAGVPMHVLQDIVQLLEDAKTIGTVGNRNVLTDVMVAAHLLQAAAMSCEINILINLKFVTPCESRKILQEQLQPLRDRVLDLVDIVLTTCNNRIKLVP